MNISITPELEGFIASKVQSGMYQSASEVVREALRLLSEREEYKQKRIEELRREIEIGWQSAERGEFLTPEESQEDMRKHKEEFFRNRRKENG